MLELSNTASRPSGGIGRDRKRVGCARWEDGGINGEQRDENRRIGEGGLIGKQREKKGEKKEERKSA
jgi:hypothetical protein